MYKCILKTCLVTFVLAIFVPSVHSQNVSQEKDRVFGKIVDGQTGEALPHVNIALVGTNNGTSSNSDGDFNLGPIPAGAQSLRFTYLGYGTKILEITIGDAPTDLIVVRLTPEPLSFKEVVVTPGAFSIMGRGPTVRQSLTREDLEAVPFGEDIYRATTRLPGISGSDFSAKFSVRGGENDEVLVIFDGLELYEPFHLKDIEGGALSVIDVAAVDGIDLLTGGFPAEYGDRMSGVFNIRSVQPSGRPRTSVGLSFMNARVMTQGSFENNKGGWFVSGRRGYLDLVLDLMGEEDPPRPVYYDFLGKVDYEVHPSHRLSLDVLYAQDRLDYIEDDDDEDQTSYGNGYVWATLKSVLSRRLFVQSMASFGHITHDRNGTAYAGDRRTIDFTVTDKQTFDVLGFKQDWHLDLTDRWLAKWGADVKTYSAEYDYFSTKLRVVSGDPPTLDTDTTAVDIDPSGTTFGTYLSSRFLVAPPVTMEVGLRFDHNSYTNDDLWSPRINAAYALGRQTFLRGGWGYFYQSDRIHEIKVGEGEREFREAQLAKHWVAGIEHTFRNGYNVRVEGYFKDASRLQPDYRNFSNALEIFPELEDDRFRLNLAGAESQGAEVYFKYDRGGRWTWWSSYSMAWTRDDIESLVFNDVVYTEGSGEYAGASDQRHAISLDGNFRPNREWRFNASWHFRSGWPYTPVEVETAPGPNGSTLYFATYGDFNSARYPSYHRLDLTINRYFSTPQGPLSLFLSIINVYNHENVRNIEYDWVTDPRTSIPTLIEEEEHWFKLLPSIGVSWSLVH